MTEIERGKLKVLIDKYSFISQMQIWMLFVHLTNIDQQGGLVPPTTTLCASAVFAAARAFHFVVITQQSSNHEIFMTGPIILLIMNSRNRFSWGQHAAL